MSVKRMEWDWQQNKAIGSQQWPLVELVSADAPADALAAADLAPGYAQQELQ